MVSYQPLNSKEKYSQEISEAKELLTMFGADPLYFMDCYDIDELRSQMYGIEGQLLDVIEDRSLIKEIFNNENKRLKEKAEDLHTLFVACKFIKGRNRTKKMNSETYFSFTFLGK